MSGEPSLVIEIFVGIFTNIKKPSAVHCEYQCSSQEVRSEIKHIFTLHINVYVSVLYTLHVNCSAVQVTKTWYVVVVQKSQLV